MIDFRYFLISIVAVFLALGIGIVMGSGVLGGPILEGLERRADAVTQRNESLRSEIDELEERRDDDQEFADSVEPFLVGGELVGEHIVLVQAEGTAGDLIDSVESVIEAAGGTVASRIILSEELALDSETDVGTLATLVNSDSADATQVRADAGAEIGNRLAATAVQGAADLRGFARGRAQGLLRRLEDEGFVTIERLGDVRLIPSQAGFAVVAGSPGEPSYDIDDVVVPFASRAAAQGPEVVVIESSDSTWGVVESLRDVEDIAAQVSTVDDGETVPGRVAITFSLSGGRGVGHWGTGAGAEAVVPTPPG